MLMHAHTNRGTPHQSIVLDADSRIFATASKKEKRLTPLLIWKYAVKIY